jgi:hypothetical protein
MKQDPLLADDDDSGDGDVHHHHCHRNHLQQNGARLSSSSSRFRWLFDVRTGAVIVTLWSAVIVVLGGVLGFFNSPFFQFGPSETAVFFSQPINTWPRWCGIVVYTLVQQLVSTYALETISPWMMNQVQNRRVRTLRESEPMTLSIVSFWYLYMWISRVVSIQILLSQIDFLILVLAVDLLTTFLVTKFYYLRDKHTGIYIFTIFSFILYSATLTFTHFLALQAVPIMNLRSRTDFIKTLLHMFDSLPQHVTMSTCQHDAILCFHLFCWTLRADVAAPVLKASCSRSFGVCSRSSFCALSQVLLSVWNVDFHDLVSLLLCCHCIRCRCRP